jgi:uncharacterized protein YfdQ (DUF2303 family)
MAGDDDTNITADDEVELEPLSAGADLAELAREVERLTRNALTDRPAVGWVEPTGVLAQVLRPGDELVIRDLERYLDEPRHPRGTYTVHDGPSFVTLVKRLGDDRTTLWAQQRATGAASPSITAVLNDSSDLDDAVGWRDHRVTLQVRVDPDWAAWEARDATLGAGRWMSQVDLAEFLTDQLHNIVEPRPAELIAAVTTFSTKRNVTFGQSVRLESGEQEFVYTERNTEDAGRVALPQKLTLNLRPFYGADTTALEVAVRYRISKEGGLALGLFRIRPDRAEDAAWADVCARVGDQLDRFPLLQGPPPAPLRTG